MNMQERLTLLFAKQSPVNDQEAIKQQAASRFGKIYGKFSKGRLSPDEFKNNFQMELVKAYKSAFALGKGNDQLTNKDLRWVNSFAAKQFDYLEAFVDDLKSGREPISNAARVALYGNTVGAAYWKGAAMEFDGPLDWVLGMNDTNCDDCEELAAGSPYEPEDLPTVPGAGDTACLSNCHCTLVSVGG